MKTELVKKDTILVVDDIPTNLSILFGFLVGAGFEVLIAETGEGAIRAAEDTRPDLILLDIMMPGMDGFETCRCLKEKQVTQDIPIIFMTALDEAENKVKGFSLGAVDYITKPLQYDELIARVRTHLNIRHLTQQLQEQNRQLEREIQERQRIEVERSHLLEQERQARAAYQVAQQEAEAAHQRSIRILESITDAFIALDQTWHFVYLNQQAERLLQRQRQDLLGRCFWDEFPKVIGTTFDHEYRRAVTEQVSVTFEAFYPPTEGWYEVHAYPAQDGLSVYFQDITDRKQSQQELQRQNLRSQLFAEVALKIRQSLQLNEILQTSVDEVQRIFKVDRVLILRLLPNGWVKVVTEAVLPEWISVIHRNITDDCFGQQYLQKYIQGRVYMISDVDTADVEPCLIRFLQEFHVKAKLVVPILAREDLWGLLIAHQCDAPRQWSEFEIDLLQQLSNQISIALAQAELLEVETRQREELARSNAELQQFAYVASHDLQEPLRMVTSYLQLLSRRYQHQLDANADDFIAYAVDGATRMQALIQDLLAYSRVGTRGNPFELIDCNTILKQAITNLKIAIEESKATITYGKLPQVLADKSQLSQLFQNLLSNAIKFQGEQAPIVEITAEHQLDEWLFSVKDNGIGMDTQYAERIFIIFQRLHNRKDYPGTGIGLAICKKIIERHGGRIWVQSEEGNGATFYFTIPDRESDHHDI